MDLTKVDISHLYQELSNRSSQQWIEQKGLELRDLQRHLSNALHLIEILLEKEK